MPVPSVTLPARVLASPGMMDTPANRKADPRADYSKWVQPGQVATLALSLSSDGLSQVSGAAIPVYGTEV